MKRFLPALEECKLYGMIAAICAIVWITGYSARVEQRWRETEWLAPPVDAPDGLATVDWDEAAADGLLE